MEFCEAYSGKCVTPGPVLDYPFDTGIPTAGMTPRGPVEVKELPATGFTYGSLLLLVLVMGLVGALLVFAANKLFR